MISTVKYILYLLLFLALQLMVLDFVSAIPMTQAIIFFFFILILPRMQPVYLMLAAFGVGLLFDLFYRTPGINAAACVLLAFIRDPLLRLFKEDEEAVNFSAHISYLGFGRFFFYILFCSFIFHLIVTFLTDFSFGDVFLSLLRVVLSTAVSVLLIYIFEILFFYRRVAGQ